MPHAGQACQELFRLDPTDAVPGLGDQDDREAPLAIRQEGHEGGDVGRGHVPHQAGVDPVHPCKAVGHAPAKHAGAADLDDRLSDAPFHC